MSCRKRASSRASWCRARYRPALQRASAWLNGIHDLAGRDFMQAGQGRARGGGRFSAVTSRAMASSTPFFRDLAPDVFQATGDLLALLAEVQDAAEAIVAGGAASIPASRGPDQNVATVRVAVPRATDVTVRMSFAFILNFLSRKFCCITIAQLTAELSNRHTSLEPKPRKELSG